MTRPVLATFAALALAAPPAPAQTVTFTTLGPTGAGTTDADPPKLTTLLRLVPDADADAATSPAVGAVAGGLAGARPLTSPAAWVPTGRPAAGVAAGPQYAGAVVATPFLHPGHPAVGGWNTGAQAGTNTTITYTRVTNTYTNTLRFAAPLAGVGMASHPATTAGSHPATHLAGHKRR